MNGLPRVVTVAPAPTSSAATTVGSQACVAFERPPEGTNGGARAHEERSDEVGAEGLEPPTYAL